MIIRNSRFFLLKCFNINILHSLIIFNIFNQLKVEGSIFKAGSSNSSLSPLHLILMRACIKVLAILLVVSNIRCSGDSEVRQIGVNEDVIFNLLPSLSHFGYRLNFSFQSDSLYNCENAGFVYTSKSTADDISVHLLGVRIPEYCISGHAPAFEKVDVPGEDGYYSISIDIGEYIHNTGYLVIENSTYTLYMNDMDGMVIPNDVMIRIPEGTIWGYVEAADFFLQNQVSNFVRTRLDAVTDDPDLPEGYYGYYSVTPSNDIYTLFPTYHNAQSCFAFQFLEDHTILENTIADIRTQLPPNTDFKVFTWKGIEL